VTAFPEPNGCSWCGVLSSMHGRRWHREAGMHQWTAPTDAQRLDRMKARREARITQPEPEPPDLTNLTGIQLRDEGIEKGDQP
jgi:hypothetical protein